MLAIKNNPYSDFSGISLPVKITAGKNIINDDLLFTHLGIGGPAAYRASLYDLSNGIKINLLPNIDIMTILTKAKNFCGRKQITSILSEYLPSRIARYITQEDTRNIADIRDSELIKIAQNATELFIPGNKIKYHSLPSAEVTHGGIDTHDISSKTMESKLCPGLFFAGEVIDCDAYTGGFNLQIAWATAYAAGMSV